jgi:hypothetical protein
VIAQCHVQHAELKWYEATVSDANKEEGDSTIIRGERPTIGGAPHGIMMSVSLLAFPEAEKGKIRCHGERHPEISQRKQEELLCVRGGVRDNDRTFRCLHLRKPEEGELGARHGFLTWFLNVGCTASAHIC